MQLQPKNDLPLLSIILWHCHVVKLTNNLKLVANLWQKTYSFNLDHYVAIFRFSDLINLLTLIKYLCLLFRLTLGRIAEQKMISKIWALMLLVGFL